MLFTRNKIKEGEETVAEKLRSAREEKNISIEIAAQKTGINRDYLSALESGHYNKLPSGVYEKTYLKKYSTYLGLKFQPLEKIYTKENGLKSKEKNDVFAKRKINTRELLVFPKIIRNILIIIFVIILFLYLGFYLQNSFSEPKMTITSPVDNFVTNQNSINVAGQADKRTQVTINGKQILKDEAGDFQEIVELKKGLNTIIIIAQNKYSREKVIEKQILVK